MIGFSLIIPTYNRSSYLAQTLRSLHELAVPTGAKVEVLVIENNCTDNTAEAVAWAAREHPLSIRCVNEPQQGLCFGRNRGLAEAQYENLVYLDDDILVSPQWLVSCLEAHRDFGADAVVGPVFPIFEQPQPEYLRGLALDIISSGYSRKGDVPLLLPPELSHELPGCNFGVTKEMVQRLNGFNTQLDRAGDGLLAGGDTDFGMRLVATGGRTAYHPGCWIKHVMVQEKLSKVYLRKRAFGNGATVRRMTSRPASRMRHFRRFLGATRLWLEAIWSHLIRHPEAFNRELRARTACGHLWG